MGTEKKYMKLYNYIVEGISSGKFLPGDKLPTEMALSEEFSLSRQTVRRALTELEDNNLIHKIQGSGAYVSETAKDLRKSMRIAVITTYISEYLFPPLLREIEKVTAENGYSMLLSATNNSLLKERDILTGLLSSPVDGIIIEGTKTTLPNPNISIFRELASRNIPLVFLNACYPELMDGSIDNLICLKVDDHKGGFLMTKGLIRAGHRNIGAVFKSDDIQGIHRFSGYLEAMSINDMIIDDKYMLWYATENKFEIRDLVKKTDMLHKCSAIICYNDEIAEQIIELVMEDPTSTVTSVRGFDGVLKNPPIDFYSCHYPNSDMGRLLAKKLFSIISGNREQSMIVPWY